MNHRFYLPIDLIPGNDAELQGEEFHHAARVVRVREGESIELFDGRGGIATGRVKELGRDRVIIQIEALTGGSRESPLRLHLAMAIIQLERFELVLQKATELGAHSILPIVTDRVEVRAERYRGKTERWEKIIFEAVKQCGRARIPVLHPPVPFRDAIATPGLKIVYDADDDATAPEAFEEATLFIGPEGGLSEGELAAAREHGARFARLGPRRLRAETAAITALAVTAATFGDLR